MMATLSDNARAELEQTIRDAVAGVLDADDGVIEEIKRAVLEATTPTPAVPVNDVPRVVTTFTGRTDAPMAAFVPAIQPIVGVLFQYENELTLGRGFQISEATRKTFTTDQVPEADLDVDEPLVALLSEVAATLLRTMRDVSKWRRPEIVWPFDWEDVDTLVQSYESAIVVCDALARETAVEEVRWWEEGLVTGKNAAQRDAQLDALRASSAIHQGASEWLARRKAIEHTLSLVKALLYHHRAADDEE